MECDADTGKVNQKLNAEVPADWVRHFKVAQSTPHPFIVNQPGREDFYDFGAFLTPHFPASCPVLTRPLKEVVFDVRRPGVMMSRDSWNGAVKVSTMTKRGKVVRPVQQPALAYNDRLPISKEKYLDVNALAAFTSPPAKYFFENLPHQGQAARPEDLDVEDEDNGDDIPARYEDNDEVIPARRVLRRRAAKPTSEDED